MRIYRRAASANFSNRYRNTIMALSASSMASRIQTYVLAVTPAQVVGAGTISGYQLAIMEAFCQGIIDEIHSDAVVTTSDAQGGTNTGTIA